MVHRQDFMRELAQLLNRHGWDAQAHTPDHILAEHIWATLRALQGTRLMTAAWHGVDLGGPIELQGH